MPQVGIPLENLWSRWPGLTYHCRCSAGLGPHSAVIAGIARAGINALIELAGGKHPRGRPAGLFCDSPQVQDAVGRADAILNAGRAYRTAMITQLWNTLASGKETTIEQRARARLASSYTADSARQAMDLAYHHGGSTSFKRESRFAECWPRPPHSRPDGHPRTRMVPDRWPHLSRPGARPALALAQPIKNNFTTGPRGSPIFLVLPAKAGIYFADGHRPSPV
jgi:hypothetical protein